MTLQIKPYSSGDIMLLGMPMKHDNIKLVVKADNINCSAYSVVDKGEVLCIFGAKKLKRDLVWAFAFINHEKLKLMQKSRAFARLIKQWLADFDKKIEVITESPNYISSRWLMFLEFKFNGYLFERKLCHG